MRYFFMLLTCLVICVFTYAQNNIGIGTNAPNASAILELKAGDKGVLIPRTSSAGRLAIVNPAKGLLVYDTTSSCFWFFDPGFTGGWAQVASGNLNTRWSLTGNAGINPAQNFIGTTDNQPLHFKVNNTDAGVIYPDGNLFFGLGSGNPSITGTGNTGIGQTALSGISTGENNTAIGTGALSGNTTGYSNSTLGAYALYHNTNRSNLVAIGDSALYNNGLGATIAEHSTLNIAIGSKALFSNTTGFSNTALGHHSLSNNTTGISNIAIGANALTSNIDGSANVAIGLGTLAQNTNGSGNQAIGSEALSTLNGTSSSNNTALGNRSLYYLEGGSGNTALGAQSGFGQPSNYLYNCTLIGTYTDCSTALNASQNMTAIGYSAIAVGNNSVRIGNTSVTQIGGQVSWTSFSDGRYKKHIAENVKGLDFILKLRPVTYNLDIHTLNKDLQVRDTSAWSSKYDIEKIRFSGFIAQEVESAAKSIDYEFSGVDKPQNPNGQYGLRYAEFVVPLVKAMQEQQQQVESLKKENAEIKLLLQRLINDAAKK